MKDFQMFLDSMREPDKRERMENILKYVKEKFPQLKEEIKRRNKTKKSGEKKHYETENIFYCFFKSLPITRPKSGEKGSRKRRSRYSHLLADWI